MKKNTCAGHWCVFAVAHILKSLKPDKVKS